MRIVVTQTEVQNAIVGLLEKNGVVVKDRNVAVSFTLGRKNKDGLIAFVDLEDPTMQALPTATVDEDEDPDADLANTTATVADEAPRRTVTTSMADARVVQKPREPDPVVETITEKDPAPVVEAKSTDAPESPAPSVESEAADEPVGEPEASAVAEAVAEEEPAPAPPAAPKSLFAKQP